MRDELDEMLAVMLGHEPPPVDRGVMTLQETADAYFARCTEIMVQIRRLEADGHINKGEALYRFRTGELRDIMEMLKRASDLGSRRLTYDQYLHEQRYGFDGD